MRRVIGASLLVCAILAVPSLELYAQKDKQKKMGIKDGPPVDSSKLQGEFLGTLKSVPGSDRIFLLESETKRLVPTGKGGNPNASANSVLRTQNNIAQHQRDLARARNPQERARAVQRLQNDQLQLQQTLARMSTGQGGVPPGYRIDTQKTSIEFQAAEEVKVRSLVLPEGGFDEKGNVKKLDAKEAEKLKGKDKNLPGYESSLEKLEVGQKIRVVLSPAPRKKEKEKDADKDADAEADKKMQVKLLVILEESKGGPQPKGKGKKK